MTLQAKKRAVFPLDTARFFMPYRSRLKLFDHLKVHQHQRHIR
jgi:hypothetical protein